MAPNLNKGPEVLSDNFTKKLVHQLVTSNRPNIFCVLKFWKALNWHFLVPKLELHLEINMEKYGREVPPSV